MIKNKSVLDELAAALKENKRLSQLVKKLELEIKDLRDLINKSYDAQNG